MKRWQSLLAAIAASVTLGVPAGLALAAADAAKAPVRNLAADPNAKDLILKGDAKCTGCHDEADEPTGAATMLELNPSVLSIGKTKHGTTADKRTPTCTDCHGESNDHRLHKGSGKPPVVDRSFRKTTKTSAEARANTCMTCHQKDAKRSHWDGSAHQTRDVACDSCHQVHSPKDKVRNKLTQSEVCFTCHKEQRAQVNRPSRHPVLEGKVACSDCHNTHGSSSPKQLVKDSVNETCYECHMEKRGPFLHEHQPVTEDCGICHNPHGTTAPTLLRQRQPLLCQSCHNVTTGAGAANHRGQFVQQLAGRSTTDHNIGAMGSGCLNCHVNIHGSNSTTATGTGGRFRR
jgi:DmsE family decaheme c-type cytochrome